VFEAHGSIDWITNDRLENMIRDVGAQSFTEVLYENMSSDVETLLHCISTNFTRLSTMLRLMNLKALNGWTNKNFTKLF